MITENREATNGEDEVFKYRIISYNTKLVDNDSSELRVFRINTRAKEKECVPGHISKVRSTDNEKI